jgi:arabinofuranosyltransferase
VIALVRARPAWTPALGGAAALGAVLVGVLGPVETTLRPGNLAPVIRDTSFVWGINDERDYFVWGTSILQYGSRTPYPDYPWMDDGKRLRERLETPVVRLAVGMMGLYAGPGVHVIDKNGLGDPLLARLPIRADIPWRIGHFERDLPEGYVDSVATGRNVLRDPALARFYDRLLEIVAGDLWSASRLKTIAVMNLGPGGTRLPGWAPHAPATGSVPPTP